MKKFRALICLAAALILAVGAMGIAPLPARAEAYAYYDYDYEGLIGSMEVVNCASWTSLRAYPDTGSARLAQVPLGAVVTNCYYCDEKYTYCVYQGVEGYILNNNLAFIYGPYGYEYDESAYMGNMEITNCTSYASLRAYPDTRADMVARVPLGSIVTNVFYEDDRFCYCMYGELEGYILNTNLSWISGGSDAYIAEQNWLGDCVIINCASYASLREYPDTRSERLARVPLGATVTDCYFVDDRFACCTYNGIVGYILIDNLGQ